MTVHCFLVTTTTPASKMTTWAATAMFSNWIEGRETGDRETWQVMVPDEYAESFIGVAQEVGVTVEEVIGAGETETYELRVGDPGTGWEGATTP